LYAHMNNKTIKKKKLLGQTGGMAVGSLGIWPILP
jgi:hypothetical protein